MKSQGIFFYTEGFVCLSVGKASQELFSLLLFGTTFLTYFKFILTFLFRRKNHCKYVEANEMVITKTFCALKSQGKIREKFSN